MFQPKLLDFDDNSSFKPTGAQRGENGELIGGIERVDSRVEQVCDLSSIYPDSVVATSKDLGWENIRVLQMRHENSSMIIPPLKNHCIIIQFWPSLHLSGSFNGQYFSKRIVPGDLTIIPAGVTSEWRWQENRSNNTLQLYLTPECLRAAVEMCELDYSRISIQPVLWTRDEKLRHIGMSLLYELKEAGVLGRLYADSLATSVGLQLVKRFSHLNRLQVISGGIAPRKLRKVIELINDLIEREQEVKLSVMAEAIGMSYYHFSRSFKQSMGISPINYLIGRRIDRAKKLLAETVYPISEIALRVGFASQSHFTNTFHKLVGTTPKAFRVNT